MEGMEFISCIRFSIQLFMAEAFFTFEWEKRHHFPLRLAGSLEGYVLCSGLAFLLFPVFPEICPLFIQHII